VANCGTAARLGGDEFLVILSPVMSRTEGLNTAEGIVEVLSEPLMIAGNRRVITVDVGVAFGSLGRNNSDTPSCDDFPLLDIQEMLTRADMALHRTKSDSNRRLAVYTDLLSEQVQANVAGEVLVRDALRHDWVDTWLQPIVEPATDVTVAAEALVRITTPDGVQHSPMEFIEVAEASELIIELGAAVLDQALDWLAIHRRHDPNFRIAVNVSVRQLSQPEYPRHVGQALERRSLTPSGLIIEVTERLMLQQHSTAYTNLERISQLGCGIAIDDFGTGYASLTAFQQLPADEIKIDRSFVSRILAEREARAIVAATVSISHSLDRVVIAEGVETADQVIALQELGVDYIQGYFYSPPIARSDFNRQRFHPIAKVQNQQPASDKTSAL
jgi:EAL domain-containing protein (putative c-di-GMP-specific phosphodiesterase class I)